MNNFIELTYNEIILVEGGGVLSGVAGALIGGIVGTAMGGIAVVVTRNEDNLFQGTISGGTAGLWAGLGAPIP